MTLGGPNVMMGDENREVVSLAPDGIVMRDVRAEGSCSPYGLER